VKYETNEYESIERRDFTPNEIRAFVGLLGIFSVCGVTCYLANPWVLFALLGVRWIMQLIVVPEEIEDVPDYTEYEDEMLKGN
jgi:hypothetical protein